VPAPRSEDTTGGSVATLEDEPSTTRRRRLPLTLPGAASRRLAAWHLAAPAAMTLVLAFRAGGYFPGITGAVAVGVALLLVLRLTIAGRPLAGWSLALTVIVGSLGVFAAWILVSSAWSHSAARALLQFDRALLYLLVVALTGSAAARADDLAAVLRWLAGAVTVVAVAALLSRLLPDLVPTSPGVHSERLAFPLTYWNALGVFVSVGLILVVHLCASAREHPGVRVVAAVAIPVLAVTLFLTFSRGAIAVALLGLVVYAVLAHPRGLLTALLTAAPPAAVALTTAYRASLLSTERYTAPAAQAQGRHLALVLVGAAIAAALLRLAGLRMDRWLDRLRVSGRGVAAGVAAAMVAIVVAGAALDAPRRLDDAWGSFTHGNVVRETGHVRDRLTEVGNNGRIVSWRVAWHAFQREPLRGTGGGTYRLTWERHRPFPPFQIREAHSLYLQTLSELGVPGLAVLLVALVTPLGLALAALRRPVRHAAGAFAGAWLAVLVHAGVDWDWEMPVLFVGLLGAAGVLAAAPAGSRGAWSTLGRVPRLAAALAVLVLAATPALVAASQSPLDAAVRAFHAGDCNTAVDRALASAGFLRLRPEPFEILAWCDAQDGALGLAAGAMTAARALDPGDWRYVYGLAVITALRGRDARALADAAVRRNPLEPLAHDLARSLRHTAKPARWRQIAAHASIPEG
jgi:hypothetical protein